jgi:Tfp pilus assembly PilM family ATPase
MPNLLSKIVDPWYPATAIGLERGIASVVQLEKGRGNTCTVRRAATFDLSESIIQPSFDARNIENPTQLANILSELVTSAGLMRQKRWSLSLPETTTRTLVFTMESQPQTNSELQEILRWKMERGFGAPLEELSVSKERLEKDSSGRDRYMAVAIRREVLAEYESLIASLGWRAGLMLPRHIGESQWLLRNGQAGDSLLMSGSESGFTAVILRDKHPLIVRTVNCGKNECDDEFYRLLLFYRDRRSADGDTGRQALNRLMVIGDGLTHERVEEIVTETTGESLRPMAPHDLGLVLPGPSLSFDSIAAAAGLATLSF